MPNQLENLFTFALDFYRAPLQHQGQLANYPPDSDLFTHLLEIVSRSTESTELTDVAGQLDKSPENLLNAALFLIRQVLFAEKGSHYKVLGLQQTASPDDIKKRYRLLIGLFHPDRNPEGEEWSKQYAPDLNEAYNVLKKPGKRSNYDLILKESQPAQQNKTSSQPQPARAAPPPRPRRRKAPARAYRPSAFEWIYRFTFWQKHPYITIWGSVLTVFAIVLILSMRSPKHTFEVTESKSAESSQTAEQTDLTQLNDASQALQFALQRSAPGLGGGGGTRLKAEGNEKTRLKTENYRLKAEGGKAEGNEKNRLKTEGEKAEGNTKSKPEQAVDVAVTVDLELPSAFSLQPSATKTKAPTLNHPVPQPATTQSAAATPSALSLQPSASEAVKAEVAVEVPSALSLQPSASEAVKAEVAVEVPSALSLQPSDLKPRLKTEGEKAEGKSKSKPESQPSVEVSAVAVAVDLELPSAFSLQPSALQSLLTHYISAYDSGNLDQMTSLFTDTVKTDDGNGIAIIKRDYSNLFNNTAERRIMVRKVHYENNDSEKASIHFEADVQVRNSRFSNWNFYSGNMSFDVVEADNSLQISRLSHNIRQVTAPASTATSSDEMY